MIKWLPHSVPVELLKAAADSANTEQFRYAINEPSGKFFYDPWYIKEEFKGTVWEQILSSLPYNVGEARVITLSPGSCYQAHADIDDRYHLNIQGDCCYLIDLNTENMYKVNQDGVWYDMDAGPLHSAANFGRLNRIQLVVRQLLNSNKLADPVSVSVYSTKLSEGHARFIFDQRASQWLNRANKIGLISDFEFINGLVKFNIEKFALQDFSKTLDNNFEIKTV